MSDTHLLATIGQYALIYDAQGRLLVLERARSKTWCLPGGRLGIGEDWEEGLLRELREETGLVCANPTPFAVNVIADAYQTKYCAYFTVSVASLDSLVVSGEHAGFRWITGAEAATLGFEDEKVRDVALKYFAWAVYTVRRRQRS